MKKVITIGGSSSKKSINKALAEYTGSLITGVEVVNIDLNDYNLPIYSIDDETENGFSSDLLKLNKMIESADGFVVSLAEHNGAYSAAFKNAFDWLSRIEGKLWRGKPMILLATSPGARGGQSVLEIATDRFPRHNAELVASISIPSFNDNFKEGKMSNLELNEKLILAARNLKEAI
jgi:NAD(P)H-dependent FMN reductase